MVHQFSGNPQRPAISTVQQWRKRLFATGVAMTVLGVLAIIMPAVSSYAVNFLIGTILTLGGLFAVLLALPFRGTRAFVWMLLAGLFPLCAGLYLLLFPTSGLTMLTFLIAAILLLTGVAQCLSAFDMRANAGAGWLILSGVISIGLGIVIFAVLPQASTVVLGVLLGIDLISTGVSLMLLTAALPRPS